ncbi:MAG: hypothetical protein J6Q92_02495 [Oscillospiraceae bacterium]|nr:hypothetical protein [Oscillospiraceae bacterium]
MNICDLHTHVLPGVDDGAATMEYALQMLRNGAASDVSVLAVTPHWGGGYGMPRDLQTRFEQLKAAAKDIPVRLVLGAEARADENLLGQLAQGSIPTINGSRYLLTEFAPDAKKEDFLSMLQSILDLGYVPLVAHPERYEAVCRAPQIVTDWLDMGCHLQLTGGSILGDYGQTVRRTAACLLKNDLVACIASDAHSTGHRSNFLMGVYDHISVQYSKQYAKCLLWETPMGICANDRL